MSEASNNYNDKLQSIQSYYSDTNADMFRKIANNATTKCDVNAIAQQLQYVKVVTNVAGDVIGYDYTYTTPQNQDTPVNAIDSNTQSGEYPEATGGGGFSRGGGAGRDRTARYPGTMTPNTVAYDDEPIMISGAIKGTTSIDLSRCVVNYVDPSWVAVAVASKMGKNINAELYQNDPNYWDTLLSQKDPAIWDKITVDMGNGKRAIRVFYRVHDDGTVSQYIGAEVVGYIAMAMRDAGMFASGEMEGNYNPTVIGLSHPEAFPNPMIFCDITKIRVYWYNNGYYNYRYWEVTGGSASELHTYLSRPHNSNDILLTIWTSNANIRVYQYDVYWSGGKVGGEIGLSSQYPGRGQIVTAFNISQFDMTSAPEWNNIQARYDTDMMLIAKYANITIIDPVPGVTSQDGAIDPSDAIVGNTPSDVITSLNNSYPTLMGSPIQTITMDDSCNDITNNYYSAPISYSTTNTNVNNPVTGTGQSEINFSPDMTFAPQINVDNIINQVIEALSGNGAGEGLTEEPTEVIPSTGTGTTPAEAVVVAYPSALWTVYNPTYAQINAFGAWLWSPNFIDNILKIFNNPMDAIYSLFSIPLAPPTSGTNNIVVGCLDSGVSSKVVSQQYTTFNCGAVHCYEYFGNVFDYAPYTKIQMWLPYIGFVPLDPDYVMRSDIQVGYAIDVFTGACTATLSVRRDGYAPKLYCYSGNMAVYYPISAASFTGIISGIINAVAGMGISMATDTPMGAMSAVNAIQSAHIDIGHSGKFSGNHGILSPQTPYLVIERPQIATPPESALYGGFPCNDFVTIGNMNGYVRCLDVQLNGGDAYKEEIDEIYTILQSGVIL